MVQKTKFFNSLLDQNLEFEKMNKIMSKLCVNMTNYYKMHKDTSNYVNFYKNYINA